ncbi:MAG: hypothetical protein JSS72_01815 [Armatimonadetes bacterium]|nr:hypothetical protein [Armatimonadota bacterium]
MNSHWHALCQIVSARGAAYADLGPGADTGLLVPDRNGKLELDTAVLRELRELEAIAEGNAPVAGLGGQVLILLPENER